MLEDRAILPRNSRNIHKVWAFTVETRVKLYMRVTSCQDKPDKLQSKTSTVRNIVSCRQNLGPHQVC